MLPYHFSTTQLHWQSEFDILIQPTPSNGLKKPSLLRLNKFATIDKELILGLLGALEKNGINLLNTKLKMIFKLNQD